jgi:uncharacterized membrane protein YoaK (UPF0700 family)
MVNSEKTQEAPQNDKNKDDIMSSESCSSSNNYDVAMIISDSSRHKSEMNAKVLQNHRFPYETINLPPMKSVANINTNPPSLKDRSTSELTIIVFGGFCLAINAGFINGITYSAVHAEPVSHLSGSSTQFGLAVAVGDHLQITVNAMLIFSFTFGASISGYFIPASSFKLTRGYGPLFLIGSAILLIACILQASMPDSYLYFYFAAAACGLQNAMTTKYSGSIIRTTHVTGTFTDIGIIIGRYLRGKSEDLWKLKILIPLAVGFITGGILAGALYPSMKQFSLVLSAFVFMAIGVVYVLYITRFTHSIWKSLLAPSEELEKIIDKSSEGVQLDTLKLNDEFSPDKEDQNNVPNPLHTTSIVDAS